MGRILFISDLHFDHENVIVFDGRPFKDISEMNEAIIKKWNAVVTNADHVYVLGDAFWRNPRDAARILRRLNGNIHIIMGNHDRWLNAETKKLVNEIKDYKEVKIGDGRIVILSHYPIVLNRAHRRKDAYHLFGHVHTTGEELEVLRQIISAKKNCQSTGQAYNVGCMLDYMDYTPRELDYIIEHGEKRWKKLQELL